MRIHCHRLVRDGTVTGPVLIDTDATGAVLAVMPAPADARADLSLGTVVPAFANTHSHAFHRVLRGRTNAGGGDFWQWRTRMYAAVEVLTPDLLRDIAAAVYLEMAEAGYGAVGEFHYLHHRSDGAAYPRHDMEQALADAATSAGIALTLLDTCYLTGGFGEPLAGAQTRFGDGTVDRWLERWWALRDRLAASSPGVVLGAALHSVRAVPPDAIERAVAGLPADAPLHIHLSEQVAENEACIVATGLTPTALLERAGALSARLTVVHATHLADADIAALGAAGVSVSMCPTTEADLGDGLGHARALADAGARITIGSDQNVVVDPFAELRGLEYGARLASEHRGVFSPAELWRAGTTHGLASLGRAGESSAALAIGASCDLVELDMAGARTAGVDPAQLPFAATSADITRVVLAGRERPRDRAGDALHHSLHRFDAAPRAQTTETETPAAAQ